MANWKKIGKRGNVDDRRRNAPAMSLGALGGVGVVAMVLFTLLGGGDLSDVLNQLNSTQVSSQDSSNVQQLDIDDSYTVFASTVLGSNNFMWQELLAKNNITYQEPKLVLFRVATPSGCGGANSKIGPHYCPADKTIYLDETFFAALERRFGAEGGDVAEAYVISHEVAHHVQNLLGITDKVQARRNSSDANKLSINLELQADCFAGLWANSIKDQNVFEPGEIKEAINAASVVGDDRIQEKTTGRINPESWTHGSSEQRVEWFTRGFESGQISQCQTFDD